MAQKASPKPVIEILPDLTVAQSCLALNVSRATVDKLVSRGLLARYKLGSDPRSGARITRESIEALRASGGAQ